MACLSFTVRDTTVNASPVPDWPTALPCSMLIAITSRREGAGIIGGMPKQWLWHNKKSSLMAYLGGPR